MDRCGCHGWPFAGRSSVVEVEDSMVQAGFKFTTKILRKNVEATFAGPLVLHGATTGAWDMSDVVVKHCWTSSDPVMFATGTIHLRSSNASTVRQPDRNLSVPACRWPRSRDNAGRSAQSISGIARGVTVRRPSRSPGTHRTASAAGDQRTEYRQPVGRYPPEFDGLDDRRDRASDRCHHRRRIASCAVKGPADRRAIWR